MKGKEEKVVRQENVGWPADGGPYGRRKDERESGSPDGRDVARGRENGVLSREALSETPGTVRGEEVSSASEHPPRGAFTDEAKRRFRAWGRDLFRPRANPFGRADATNDPDGRALALWRPAWEGSVVAAAFALAAFYAWGADGAWAAPLGFCIGAFGCVRLLDVVLLLRRRAKLSGKAPAFMGWGDLVLRMRHMQRKTGKTKARGEKEEVRAGVPREEAALSRLRGVLSGEDALFAAGAGAPVKELWLGLGFLWTPVHAQRLFELSTVAPETLFVSPFVKKLVGVCEKGLGPGDTGSPVLHGVGDDEGDLFRPLSSLGGGTAIVGTTQAGKGVMLTNLVRQAILRGDPVVVIDPKSSKRLRNAVFAACRAAGRAKPREFHPAFPDRGIRFDPFGSFARATELATRVKAVMPADTSGAFSSFAWQAVLVVVEGLLFVDRRPSLRRLADTIESGIDALLDECLTKHLTDFGPEDWPARVRAKLDEVEEQGFRRGERNLELSAKALFWEETIKPRHPEPVLNRLIDTYRHDREHYAKITASLMPVLAMLTAGSLAKSLSPDREDPDDLRDVETLEGIIGAGGVFYVGLDALPDSTVASALGSILLADLTALAGARYNEERSGASVGRISLFVDEVFNVINEPLIELLNKGMEAGVHVTVAMQTIPDLTDRLGSEAKARMALGNLNNLIALRTKDRATQDFVAETFGKTTLWQTEVGITTGAAAHVKPNFSASVTKRMSGMRDDIVPRDWLGRLPNLEFFASLSGGKLYKGRIPILIDTDEGVKLGPVKELS